MVSFAFTERLNCQYCLFRKHQLIIFSLLNFSSEYIPAIQRTRSDNPQRCHLLPTIDILHSITQSTPRGVILGVKGNRSTNWESYHGWPAQPGHGPCTAAAASLVGFDRVWCPSFWPTRWCNTITATATGKISFCIGDKEYNFGYSYTNLYWVLYTFPSSVEKKTQGPITLWPSSSMTMNM